MRILLSILFVFVFIAGCDTNNSFRTAAGIESDLQGKWNKVKIPITTYKEIFEFNSGTFIHHWYDDTTAGAKPRLDTCEYEIIANMTTPYVVIHNLKPYNYTNGRWVIIDLDGKFLALNRQEDNTNGTLSREFVKM